MQHSHLKNHHLNHKTQPYLEITDGVSSVKLMDSAATTPALVAAMNYRLSFGGWSPNVATRNQNPFGLPYNAVREELTIDVKGATADVALAKLQVLNSLLDQAERWYNNEVVLPVFIRYQPKGSIKTTYLSDVIIGRGMGDQSTSPMISLPSDFNAVGDFYFLQKVRVVFWRRNGVWLCEQETLNASGVSQRTINTLTWSNAATVLSPLDIKIKANNSPDTGIGRPDGILVVTHSENYMSILNGESIGGASTADAAANSVGGNVGRFTCSTTVQELFKETFTESFYECEYLAVYATIRNNSTTLDVYLQLNVNFTNYPTLAPEIKVAFAASPLPKVVFLGLVPTRGRQPFHVGVYYRSLSGAPTFDIDQVLIVGVNRATNIISLNDFFLNTVDPLAVLNRLLLEPQPEIAFKVPTLGTFEERISYSGSAYCFAGGSSTLLKTAYMLFATHDTKWQLSTAANAAVTLDPTMIRYKAYLVPE